MKITINEFEGFSIRDVYLYDEDKNLIVSKEGLHYDMLRTYMNDLQLTHGLSSDTLVVNELYREDCLKDSVRMTLGEYLS